MPDPQMDHTAYFIGDVAQDDYYWADRWPGLADKAVIRENKSFVGGMIANAACVHAGLGGPTEFISLLNPGVFSQALVDALSARDVRSTHMIYDPAAPDSRNFIFLCQDEHVVLTVDVGERPMCLSADAMAALRSPGYLYTTIGRAKRLTAGALRGAALLADLRSHGRKMVFDLDVDGFSAEDAECLRGADIVIMNEVGFGNAFGDASPAHIHDWMAQYGVKAIIRTLAEAGAEAYDGSSVIRVGGYSVPVVDVTGAGDTFGGALVYAMPRMPDLASAMELAIAAAARSVTIEGPQGGVASLQDIERFRRDFAAKRSGA
jgi:ribokinase